MFRAALFSAVLVASVIVGNQTQTAEACGTNRGPQRPANVVRSTQSKNPSKILVVGERDSSLLKELSNAKHRIEYVSTVRSAKHSRYDLIIADESDLEAVRARFGKTDVLKKKSTVSSTLAYTEMMLERTAVASHHNAGPVDTTPNREPVEAHGEGRRIKPVQSGRSKPVVAFAFSSPESKVSASTSTSRKPESATGQSAQPGARDEVQADSSGKWTRSLQFGTNRVELDARAMAKLSANADWLKHHANTSIVIEGHSDSVGDEAYNLDLSERRANVARNYMVDVGIAEGRITVVAKGESAPAFVPSTSGKNRRIVLIKK